MAAGWMGVVSTIRRSARPVLAGWGAAAGWVWMKKKKLHLQDENVTTDPHQQHFLNNCNFFRSAVQLLPV